MSFEFYINSMFANFYITICGILDKFTVYPHILKRDISPFVRYHIHK